QQHCSWLGARGPARSPALLLLHLPLHHNPPPPPPLRPRRRALPSPPPPPTPPPPQPPSAPGAAQPPTRTSPFVPGIYVEEGTASWYGIPFHGRRAANGEIFDMNTLVAAHRTFPLVIFLRVSNLNNVRDFDRVVIDRGPSVGDRILDLARAAAVSL